MMGVGEEGDTSLEQISVCDLYPLQPSVTDQPPLYPLLPGEFVKSVGKTSDGVIALSNFRLFTRQQLSFNNIPLGLVESVEYRDIFFIYIHCKDAHSVRCTFSTNEICVDWYKKITDCLRPPAKLQEVFAFAFYAWACKKREEGEDDPSLSLLKLSKPDNSVNMAYYSFGREVERLGFDLKQDWRITQCNEEYKVCASYPKLHIVPACTTDKDLESVASFRASHRFPSVVWRDRFSGAVIVRSSQPEVGWLGWRRTQDENFLEAISAACVLNSPQQGAAPASDEEQQASKPKMLIMDCRSYTAAVANRAKGGGYECPEYYPNTEVQFMNLANIHGVRKSFQAVRALCALSSDQPGWLTGVEKTQWLQHIGAVMRAAVVVVETISTQHRPVLVHCSDGWDRTAQIVALGSLLLDPYYRTMEGFAVLVEKEWVEFGHKFADRCGHGLYSEDVNERCPIFLQWLDCVHQLLIQFPTAFQFNQAYLMKLVHHTYSCLFGTFLGNTAQERAANKVYQQTGSVWALLNLSEPKFVNVIYKPGSPSQVLRPSWHMRSLVLWQDVYMLDSASSTSVALDEALSTETSDGSNSMLASEPSTEQPPLTKTRSLDDIVSELETSSPGLTTRRLSDPNIATDPNTLLKSTQPLVNGHATEEGAEEVDEQDLCQTCAKQVVEEVGVDAAADSMLNGAVEDDSPVGCAEAINENCEEHTALPSEGGFLPSINCLRSHREVDCDKGVPDDTGALVNECAASDESVSTEVSSQGVAIAGHSALGVTAGGSTDTLTGEFNYSTSCELRTPPELLISSQTNGLDDNDETLATLEKSRAILNGLPVGSASAQERLANMSTSTTDLSDSRVCHHNMVHRLPLPHVMYSNSVMHAGSLRLNDALSALPIGADPAYCREHGVPKLADMAAEKSAFTRSISRGSGSTGCYDGEGYSSHSSTDPSTPATEKMNPMISKMMSPVWRHLDCDGLTTHRDQGQQRLTHIVTDYEQRIHILTQKLMMAKVVIGQMSSCNNGTRSTPDNLDEISSLESADSLEQGGGSTAASDVSWEQVDDIGLTLWVPDHVVSHCTSCNKEFWVAIRKHHCRNCGHVFCADCTKFSIAVPQQQLNHPVRVCFHCYNSIIQKNPTIAMATCPNDLCEESGAAAAAIS